MFFLVQWAETLLSHCEGAIKKVGGIVKAVEQSGMVVTHLHFLLHRPLTFSSGEETPCHPSDLQNEDECALTSRHAEIRVVAFYHQVESDEGICCEADLRHKIFGESAESGAGVSPPRPRLSELGDAGPVFTQFSASFAIVLTFLKVTPMGL
jgi:hypothetical protein